ncbi:MAG TPA: glycosyltransferase family 39 protein [Dehalococcoidia bacterium]|nr:glycosyltransferase family 39 protein [Dehalococcoidia bacterium]
MRTLAASRATDSGSGSGCPSSRRSALASPNGASHRSRLTPSRLLADPTARGLALITLGVVLLRLPSFFEPPWHTDEGIFAAVAQRVLSGGHLYADAWESKPPLFLYLYVAIFKVFGAGIFGLRFAATTFAVLTHLALFFVALRFMSHRRALLAAALCGVLIGVPFWEGTLALTETFTLLPSTAGALLFLLWDERRAALRPPQRRLSLVREDGLLFAAGLCFGAAFLLRQTSLAVPAAAGAWVLFRGGPWPRAALLCAAGGAAVVVPVVAAFEAFGDPHWFWDANVGFFFKYVPSGQELPFGTRPVIALPFAVTCLALVLSRRRSEPTPAWALPALWLCLTLAGALLTGRPYSHYLLQTFPPLAMLIALAAPSPAQVRDAWRRRPSPRPAALLAPASLFVASLLLLWGYVVTPMFEGNPFAMRYTRGPSYYLNFAAWAAGLRSERAYNDYFDRRVEHTRALEEALEGLGAAGEKVYIWGEYPWVYPLAAVKPATRYMTSFYVLLLPYLDVQLAGTLFAERPAYIVVMSDAKPRLREPSPIIDQRWLNATRGLETVIARDYQRVATVGRAQVYRRVPERPPVSSGITVPQALDDAGDSQ